MDEEMNGILFEALDDLYAVCPGGGVAHIVTDDFNTSDAHVLWCIQNWASAQMMSHTMPANQIAVGVRVLGLLLLWTEGEREKLIQRWWSRRSAR